MDWIIKDVISESGGIMFPHFAIESFHFQLYDIAEQFRVRRNYQADSKP